MKPGWIIFVIGFVIVAAVGVSSDVKDGDDCEWFFFCNLIHNTFFVSIVFCGCTTE